MLEEYYVVQDGVRVGFFKSREDANFGIRFLPYGLIKSSKEFGEDKNG